MDLRWQDQCMTGNTSVPSEGVSTCTLLNMIHSWHALQACQRHGTAPTASAALGRTLLGTLLIACFKAEGETTQVNLAALPNP